MEKFRVLLLGAYGFFGQRLARLLAADPRLHLLLAGRSDTRGHALVKALGPGARSGRCLLCNGWVQFLLRHDRQGHLQYASMQSRQGQALLKTAGLGTENLETLLVVEGERSWQHSAAILRILHRLGWPWRVAWLGWLIPAPWRDGAYRALARRRYRLFGRADRCLVPRPEHASRFLD